MAVDALMDLCDFYMQAVSWDIGYLPVKARDYEDRNYGEECRYCEGQPLDSSDSQVSAPSSFMRSFNSLRVGRSEISLKPKYCKNSRVVA